MFRLRSVLLSVATLAVVCVAAIGEAERTTGGDEVAPVVSRQAPLTHPIQLLSLVKVGFDNLGGNGFNGDIWAHGDFAYVGGWGIGGICPSSGVKVIDISNPLKPVMVQSLPAPNGSHPNDVKVAAISTASFQGDLLVASNEACASGGANGVQLWDVTDPLNPAELGRFDTRAVHNTYLYLRGDRAYVLLAVPFSEVFGPSAGLPASDLQIIDVTNPASPVLAGEWTIGRDAGLAFGRPDFTNPGLPAGSDCTPPPSTPVLCRGTSPSVYLHDVWASADGAVAYLSYWDAGLVTLDISDPASPALLAVATEPLSDEGNAHNAVVDELTDLILVSDEDYTPNPLGFLRVFDASDLTNPVQVGTFATANALAPPADGGWYTLHNITLAGGLAYLAWYSDGVRVLDLTHPFAPEEVASFVPPDVPDPHGHLPTKALVWGTYVQNDIVFASDMNAGLYVLGFDSDSDGCADVQEENPSPALGGQRDSTSFWDFFDVPAGAPPERDRVVNIIDIGAIVLRFGTVSDPPLTKQEALADALTPPPDMTSYHAAFDRGGPIPGEDLWDLLGPDGYINIIDIGAAVIQFGHTCA